jgi:hypothetical protein
MIGIGILGAASAWWASMLLPHVGDLKSPEVQDFLPFHLLVTGVAVLIASVFLVIGFWK